MNQPALLCGQSSLFAKSVVEAEIKNPTPPYQGQVGEEQGGTGRDVFIHCGSCSEGNLQCSESSSRNPGSSPACTNPGLATALEGNLDLAHLEVCVELDEAFLEHHSTFSGALLPTCGGSVGQRKSLELPGQKRGPQGH